MRLFVIIGSAAALLLTIGCENSGVKVIRKDIDTAAVDDDIIAWVDEEGEEGEKDISDEKDLKDGEDIKDDAAEVDTVGDDSVTDVDEVDTATDEDTETELETATEEDPTDVDTLTDVDAVVTDDDQSDLSDLSDGSDITVDEMDDVDTVTDVDGLLPDVDVDTDSTDKATIYKIKLGEITPGTATVIEGIVTGATTYSFFVQVPEAEHDAILGYTYSGIYVYTTNTSGLTIPAVGDFVSVAGTVQNYYNALQLATITAITPLAPGLVPTPVTVLPDAVATGGAMEKSYNGVLVTVEEVTVLDTTTFGFGEFSVTDDLRIDDTLYYYTLPTVGTNYESITGIMHFSFDNAKLEPRSLDDMVVATATDVDVIADADTTVDVDTVDSDSMADVDAVDDMDDVDTTADEDGLLPDDDGVYAETLCAEIAPPADGLCTGTGGSDDLLLRGVILGHDRIYRGGEVLVGGSGDILCVGCDCSAEPGYAAATIVECAEGVISPALINAHDHLTYTQNKPGLWGTERFDHRHDWRIGIREHTKLTVPGGASNEQMWWGEMRNVMAGTTVMAGSGSVPGLLRNIDRAADIEGLAFAEVDYNTFPLGDSDGTLLASGCAYPGIDYPSVLNSDCYFPHVSEGIDAEARNEFLCLSSAANGGVDLTAANSAFVHLVGLKAADAQLLAQEGTALVWSPRSNISLYGNTAPVTLFDRLGVLIGMGTDWSASGSMNMLRELKCADHYNGAHLDHYFDSRALWQMATINNATLFRVAELTGSLQVGKVADIAIFNGAGYVDDPYQAIIDANVDGVALVLRGGEPLYGDTALMAAVPGGQTGCEELTICAIGKTACIQRETGKTLAELAAANSTAYALFFCDEPVDEPTCTPLRTSSDDTRPYAGPTGDDLDGDGILNGSDNCPTLFNPIRPVDGGIQADADTDGEGDLCDPTPLGNDPTVDPNDKDGDGIPNASDNCPYDANPDQQDGDLDGSGNVCDFCPATPNPMFGSCGIIPIYDLKDGTILPGNPVETTGVVTALDGTNFFLQIPEEDQDIMLGYSFSGIYVYSYSAAPAVGDIVEISATLTLYYGLLELTDVSAITVLSSGNDLPTPVIVTDPADIATGDQYADDYNAVLVTVENVTVTDISLGFGEFAVTGGLRIDDQLYTYTMPTVGDDYDSITGILHFTYDDSKLEPRDADDMVETAVLCGSGTCEEWEECAVDTCVLTAGRCTGDGDCAEPTPTCNLTTHYCEGSGLTVQNGDFEQWTDGTTPDSWTADSGVGVAKETTTVHGGSASVKLTRNADDNAATDFMTDYIAVSAGTTYAVTAFFYDDHADTKARFFCNYYDASKVYLSQTLENSYTSDQANWQTYSLACPAPASAAYLRISFRLYRGTTSTYTGGFVYLDDVTITAP